MTAFLALVVAASSVAGLQLEISSPHNELLVGEPFKLVVRWTTNRLVKNVRVETGEFKWNSIELLTNGPTGVRTYREWGQHVEYPVLPQDIKAGTQVVTTLVLYKGGHVLGTSKRRSVPPLAFLFDQPGDYTVRAVYVGGDRPVESNDLKVSVRAPRDPGDSEVLQLIARDRSVIMSAGYAPSPNNNDNPYRLLLRKHRHSPYLRCARLQRLVDHTFPLERVYDQETREPLYNPAWGNREEFAAQHYKQLAQQILEDDTWGPFEEEALLLAYTFASRAGAQELRERARTRLLEEYSQSPSAEEIRRREGGGPPKA